MITSYFGKDVVILNFSNLHIALSGRQFLEVKL